MVVDKCLGVHNDGSLWEMIKTLGSNPVVIATDSQSKVRSFYIPVCHFPTIQDQVRSALIEAGAQGDSLPSATAIIDHIARLTEASGQLANSSGRCDSSNDVIKDGDVIMVEDEAGEVIVVEDEDDEVIMVEDDVESLSFAATDRQYIPPTDPIAVTVTSIEEYNLFVKALGKHEKARKREIKEKREKIRLGILLESARAFMRGFGLGKMSPKSRFISLDVEAFERNQTKVLEIGWIFFDSHIGPQNLSARHFVVKENLHLKNGKYVPDHRFEFGFGRTETLHLREIIAQLCADLSTEGSDGDEERVNVLIGHAIQGDIKWLRECGIELRPKHKHNGQHHYQQHSSTADDDVESSFHGSNNGISNLVKPVRHTTEIHSIFDTADLDVAYHSNEVYMRSSLKKAVMLCDIRVTAPFHNAGNDAWYTMQCFLKMTS